MVFGGSRSWPVSPASARRRSSVSWPGSRTNRTGPCSTARCEPDAVVPYQPFVEALRPYVAAYSPAVLHERLQGLEQDLTRLFPALLGRTSERPLPAVSDPEAERYRLFEAITSLLTGIAIRN